MPVWGCRTCYRTILGSFNPRLIRHGWYICPKYDRLLSSYNFWYGFGKYRWRIWAKFKEVSKIYYSIFRSFHGSRYQYIWYIQRRTFRNNTRSYCCLCCRIFYSFCRQDCKQKKGTCRMGYFNNRCQCHSSTSYNSINWQDLASFCGSCHSPSCSSCYPYYCPNSLYYKLLGPKAPPYGYRLRILLFLLFKTELMGRIWIINFFL